MSLRIEDTLTTVEGLSALAAARKDDGWRFVQMLAVNTEAGIDLVYSFMKDGLLQNCKIVGVQKDTPVPSITDKFLAAFVFENEAHDLFGVDIRDIAIDFEGNFYALAQKEPMTIISPEQQAAREKARKAASAKAAKAAKAKAAQASYAADHPDARTPRKVEGVITPSGDDDMEMKLAGMDPEKVARVRAAIAAKAKKAAAAGRDAGAGNAENPPAAVNVADNAQQAKDAELEAKLANMDPEKAAKVRAAMEAKAKRAAKEQANAAPANEEGE